VSSAFAEVSFERFADHPQLHRLLKKVTGASKVIIFDHTIRRGEKEGEESADTPCSRKPVSRGECSAISSFPFPFPVCTTADSTLRLVHVDQTPLSGRRRVERHASSPAEAERLLRGRAQLINVWRPLRGPVLDIPLAFSDARTLQKEQLVKSRLIYEPPTPEGETLSVEYSDEHRWYYLSEMQPDEGELLNAFSARSGLQLTLPLCRHPLSPNRQLSSSSAGTTLPAAVVRHLTLPSSMSATTARRASL
jgi:hypothetical protein